MTKQKSTKRALLLSALSLLMCVSMFIGSTFAWFTDSVTSGTNKIIAGNLDVELYHSDKNATDEKVSNTTKLFDDVALWEPGAMVWEKLTVKNLGSLALKYTLTVNVSDVSVVNGKSLAEVLKVAVMEVQPTRENIVSAATQDLKTFALKNGGDLAANTGVDEFYVAIYWAPSANDNDYNVADELLYANLGVTLVATQATVENDSFGNDYDAGATDPVVDEGTYGGIYWTLTESGKLTVSPASTPAPDANSGAAYEVGSWREAVVYTANGGASAIGGYPYDVNAVTSLVIEEGVTSIGSFTAKFPNLTGEVVIPSTVTYIGQEAFQNCSKITKLTFAPGGTENLCIAPSAFKKLAIEELVLPADRPEIHIHCWAFNDCVNLKSVILPANVTKFMSWTHVDYCGMDFVDYSGANAYDSQVFARCNALESITFGSQEVHDLFFDGYGNRSNINAIGGVEIVVQN